MSRPDSANTMAQMPSRPTVSMRCSGSRKPPAASIVRAPHEATEAAPPVQITGSGWFHSVQPTPDRPSAVSNRHSARGKRDVRAVGPSSTR